MYLRRFLVVVLLATAGMSSFAYAQANENSYLAAADSTVSATINGRKVLIDVPVGQTINLPAGTRLWPASPVVISGDAYPQSGSATPLANEFGVRQQLPVVQYGQQQADNARFHTHPVSEFHRTRSEFHPTAAQTFHRTDRNSFPAQSQSAVAEKQVANPHALNPVQPVISTNVVYPVNVKEVAVDASRTLRETPRAQRSLPTQPAEDALTSFDPEERAEEDVEDDSIVATFERLESAEANEIPERSELEVTEERADETVDLYADAVDPSSTEPTFEENELGDVFSEEVPHTITSIAPQPQASLEREPESVNAEKGIQLFVGEPVTSVTPAEAFTTTEEEQSTTTPENALTEVSITPGFVTEQTKAKSDLPWLLPVVFLSAIGLAWAERLRRNRSKVRFERAMEHGRRVQRLGDDEDSDTVVAPFSKLVKEVPPQNLRKTDHQPSPQVPVTPPATTITPPALEQASDFAAETERPKTAALPPVSSEPIKPFVTPSSDEFVVETVAELNTAHETEDLELENLELENLELENLELENLEFDGEPVSQFDAAEHSNDRDWAGIMGYEPHDVKDSPDDLLPNFTANTEFEAEYLAGTRAADGSDPMIASEEENQPVVATTDDVSFPTESTSDRSLIVLPQVDAELPKMRDAEGKIVENDVELDQLTGLLEDANTMRSEWAGFEQRAADFRERWIVRQPELSERDQSEA